MLWITDFETYFGLSVLFIIVGESAKKNCVFWFTRLKWENPQK